MILIVIALLSNLSPPQKAIESLISSSEGTFSVAFWIVGEPSSQLLINADESFHAASTMKTPVMIEVFKQFDLSDSILVANEFTSIVDGSTFSLDISRDGGDALYSKIGTRVPVLDIVEDMITRSGNLATNLLLERVGATNVTRSMRELDAQNIHVLRGVEDMKAFEAGLSNSTTARDLAIILDHLAKGTAISPSVDSVMVSILKRQVFRDVIPALLPPELEIASKSGSINRVVHDSAIVFLPDGRRYVLVILSKNLASNAEGTAVGAEISRIIYESLTQ
jgi:beta-lactamase class A